MSVRSILAMMAALLLTACGGDAATGAAGDSAPDGGGRSGEAVTPDDPDPDPDPGADPVVDPDSAADTPVPGATTATGSEDDETGRADSPTEDEATIDVTGVVVAAGDGGPLAGATVSAGEASTVTGPDGRFSLTVSAPAGVIAVRRPGRQGRELDLTPSDPQAGGGVSAPLVVELEPFTVRALRVSWPTAADRQRFEELLSLAEQSTVNALIFDTKDESGSVLYASEVELASTIGATEDIYDPTQLLALARDRGLYTITRIVTFEDRLWVDAIPDARLAGRWADAGNEANWRYPLDLAVEACRLGFDEIQFDYVRFPAGRTAEAAASLVPPDSESRSAVIAGFLEQAAAELHPLGCGLSAAVFGIVTSSPTDEGIGQAWEAVSAPLDAVSPMLYPSHYSDGWLGLGDPEAAPGPVVADALDKGLARMDGPTLMRPWLQAFNYNGGQVRAQIEEAENRGAGWLLWNASGNYRLDWLPPA